MTSHITVIGAVRHTHSIQQYSTFSLLIINYIIAWLLSGVLWSNLFQVMVRVGSVLDLGLVSVRVRVRVRLELALG